MSGINSFHLHGDNIVECERAFLLIQKSIADLCVGCRGPLGVPVCPSYEIVLEDPYPLLRFTLFPGFKRWDEDILDLVRGRGGALREAADVIITRVNDGIEDPLIALEYCGALPAGNQAWQRSGRAYALGKAQIPYIYITEIAGYELDANRQRRSSRSPNPAVPFSYAAFSIKNETPTLPVFIPSPGASQEFYDAFSDIFGEKDLLSLIRSIIVGKFDEEPIKKLNKKVLLLVKKLSSDKREGQTLTPRQWDNAYEVLMRNEHLVNFLVDNCPLIWSKTAYIEKLTDTARKLMDLTAEHAIGLTSKNLPMCIVPRENRSLFASQIQELYDGGLKKDFLRWLGQDKHLSVCWVMGFKKRGGDARPDRGLPPLTRMLVGDNADILTIVYGPAIGWMWEDLHERPRQLSEQNGLWESIFNVSDAILIDSATDNVRHRGYVRSHWSSNEVFFKNYLCPVQSKLLRIGENDVDTVLHLILARFGKDISFEGMCNPPGGDWSGMSLMLADRTKELRWLTLPRVSAIGGKRPDHVFQLFVPNERPIILIIESKERARSVEQHIGQRLSNYVSSLIRTPASVERVDESDPWVHSTCRLNGKHFRMASAVAFLEDSETAIANAEERAEVDIILCVQFLESGVECNVRIIPITELGMEIAQLISTIKFDKMNISVSIEN